MNLFEGRTLSPMLGAPGQAASLPLPTDFSRLLTEGLLRPVIEGLATAAVNFSDSMAALGGTASARSRSAGMRRKDHDCRHCDCGCECADSCHCNCCINDADLVIHARLGETRVIPFTLENRWRRERKIHLALSEWTRSGGSKGPIFAELLPPAPDFVLPPCGNQTIVMVVRTREPNQEGYPDVDDCEVYYADLSVTGCDIRPLRIALTLLPRDCDTYHIECSCGCC